MDAFRSFGGKAVQPLRKELEKTEDKETRKWLTIALGAAGDPTVEEQLAQMAEGDERPWVRWAVVRVYSSLAGERGIPLLRRLLDDKAGVYDEHLSTPRRIVAEAAQDSLRKLDPNWQPKKGPFENKGRLALLALAVVLAFGVVVLIICKRRKARGAGPADDEAPPAAKAEAGQEQKV